MRTVSAPTLAYLQAGVAVDSAFIVGVDWGNGQETRYLDRDIAGMETIKGRIVSIGGVDSAQSSDSTGQTSAVTITLSDAGTVADGSPLGALKTIFDGTDIHKKKARVYQYFLGTVQSDVFVLFSGVVSTPIAWSEGERTLTFDIVSKIEDRTIGFSAEFGAYQELAPSLLGQAFPFVFGSVPHVKGLQLQEIPTAFTIEPFGIVDPSIVLEISKLETEKAGIPTINVAHICGDGYFATDINCNQDDENDKAFQLGAQLQAQLDSLQTQINSLQATLLQQQPWARGSVGLQPSMTVRQPYYGTLRAGSQLFKGHFNNSTGQLDCTPLLQPGNTNIQLQLQKAGYQFFPAGTQVTIAGPYPIPFAISCVPGTVTAVYAYQSFHGLRRLVNVPSTLYTVQTLNFGGQASACVCVVLNQPLSVTSFLYNLGIQNWETNFGQYLAPHIVAQVDWDDEIYATFVSSVGPNPTDIITWLVSHYSENGIDISRAGNADLNKMNFVYQSIGGVMGLLTELAYEARCAIYLVDDTYKLVYLPNPGAAVAAITESDIDTDTLRVETTSTDDLVTQYVATFRPDYTTEFSEPIRIYLRSNISKYGLHSEDHDFIAFRGFYEVEMAATFWMIRKSMTWKILKVDLFLHNINLEVFDVVTLNFTHKYVSNGPISALVINAQYDPTGHIIHAEFWTPVRLGEMDPYVWGFYDGSETDIFPTYRDVTAGGGESVEGGNVWPLPKMNGTQWNIQLNQRKSFSQGSPNPNALEQQTDDSGAPTLVNGYSRYNMSIDDTGPGVDPYAFSEKPNIPTATPYSELSKVYPCRIGDYQSTDKTGRQIYKITIYRHGTFNQGHETSAYQLQIDPDDRIPAGTWWFCVETSWPSDNQGTYTKGAASHSTERTLQVPVWLR